tara:strand:- start:363 stop:1058 length:696 start_codon:yes stop_codon:yes gene_type:complete
MSKVTKISITAKHVSKAISMDCADLSITQEFSPTWATEQAYGKMDPIATFSHTGRTAAFEFVLLATNIKEAIALQSNVDQLIKFQYPRYTGTPAGGLGSSLAAPPFFDITVLNGKLYNTMSGYITAINIVPGSSEDVAPLVSKSKNFFERKYSISLTMTVLHAHTVGYVNDAEPGGERGFVFTSAEATSRQKQQKEIEAFNISEAAVRGGANSQTALVVAMETVQTRSPQE